MDGEHTRPDPLFVPVRASQPGMICLRTGRLASGLPIGLAFTSEASLRSVLGPRQQWTLICERALLDMLAPLGIHHLRIDPMLELGTAPAVPGGPRRVGNRIDVPPMLLQPHRCSIDAARRQATRRVNPVKRAS